MSKQAMQQALEALESVEMRGACCDTSLVKASKTALRAALAEQAQPTSEAGWLHRLDMEKSEAWMAGYAQGLKRAAEQAQPVATADASLGAAIEAIDAALAEQDEEPATCWMCGSEDGGTSCGAAGCGLIEPDPEAAPHPVAWTPVSQAMPKSGVKVLACYRNRLGNLRRIRAEWVAAKTREADSEDAEACSEYDDATDTYYTTEGWYECIDNWGDYSSVAVTEGEVTHWMPLPAAPKEP